MYSNGELSAKFEYLKSIFQHSHYKTTTMRTRKDHLHLISVVLYAETTLGQRSGKPLNVQYVYKLIDQHEKKGKKIPFDFVKIGKVYWIVSSCTPNS